MEPYNGLTINSNIPQSTTRRLYFNDTRRINRKRKFSTQVITESGRITTTITGLEDLTRYEARNVEQALIDGHGLHKQGGFLENLINSISRLRPDYEERLQKGYDKLEEVGYEF